MTGTCRTDMICQTGPICADQCLLSPIWKPVKQANMNFAPQFVIAWDLDEEWKTVTVPVSASTMGNGDRTQRSVMIVACVCKPELSTR